MLIVDSQVHIWGPNTPERPWVPGNWAHAKGPVFGAAALLEEMQVAGVHRACIYPLGMEGYRNDVCLEAAQARPDTFAVVGRVPPDQAQSRGKVRSARRTPGMVGLRFNLREKEVIEVMEAGQLDWVWKEAEEGDVPLSFFALHSMMPMIAGIAERHPRLRIVLDHLGVHPNERDAPAFREFDKFLALAKRPNVVAKLSALACMTTDAYPFANLHSYVRQTYDAFGPQRLFWGSDLTRMHLASQCTYRQAVTMMTEEIAWLNEADKRLIMGQALCDWLGWK